MAASGQLTGDRLDLAINHLLCDPVLQEEITLEIIAELSHLLCEARNSPRQIGAVSDGRSPTASILHGQS